MPYAQDHKRLEEDDKGPNTGGMGAFAPFRNVSTEDKKTIKDNVLQKAVDGLRKENRKFVGKIEKGQNFSSITYL